MPLYEYQCDACGQRFELIQKFSDPRRRMSARCAERDRCAACCRRRPFSSRVPAGTSPTTRKKGKSGRTRRRQRAKGAGATSRAAVRKRESTKTDSARRTRETDSVRRASSTASPVVHASDTRRRAAVSDRLGADRRSSDRAFQGTAGTAPPARAAAARSTPAPSGIRACCRCRGGRRRFRTHRSGASAAAGAVRSSAGFRRCDRCAVASSAGKMSGVRM